jgi:hypothetical protein
MRLLSRFRQRELRLARIEAFSAMYARPSYGVFAIVVTVDADATLLIVPPQWQPAGRAGVKR